MTKRITRPHRKPGPKGDLTAEDVALIKALLGSIPQCKIAEKFDVSPGLVSQIKHRRVWASERASL